MKAIRHQFQGIDKEAGITLLLACGLMVLFAYQGHPSFFMVHFGQLAWVKASPDFSSQVYRFLFTFAVFFLLPAGVVRFIYQKPLSQYGLCMGDKRIGGYFVLISLVVLPLPLYLTAGSSEFLKEYPLWKNVGASFSSYGLWVGLYLLYYIGWEFFFRGFLQFSLVGKIPPFFIIMLQTVASTLIHIGKPEGETFSAIIAGLVFGAVALQTRSILYPLIIHWYVGALTELFCYIRGG